jgi:succinoglycan biosynthesis transport protein ExoP
MEKAPGNETFEALRGLWKRRRRPALLVFLFLAVPLAGLIFGLPPLYQAQATILVEREDLPPTVSRPVVTRTDETETRIRALGQQTLMRSRLMELIQKYDLYHDYRAKEPEEMVLRRMRTDITVVLDRKQGEADPTVSVVIGYRGSNPKTVADVANSLAALFVKGRGEERMRQATSTAELLQAQLEDVKKKMDAQEQILGDYKARHNSDLPEQLAGNIAALQRLNQQLQLNGEWQIRAAERKEAAQRAAAAAVAGSPDDNPETHMTRLKAQLDNLRSKYSETHPDVVRLKDEIKAIASQPQPATPDAPDAPAADTAAVDAEMRALRSQESQLRSTIAGYQSRVEAAPARDTELQRLTRDYEATKALYDSLYQRETEARLAGRLEEHQAGEQFRILDPAIPPVSPKGPDRMRLLLMALAGALGAAIATALLLERVDPTFHSLDQLRAASPVPVVGSLPRLRTTAQTVRHNLATVFGTAAGLALLAVLGGATYWLAHANEELSSLVLRLGS